MLHRLSAKFAEVDTARRVAERLAGAEAAAALATSLFEEDGGRLWRLDAYFDDVPAADLVLGALAGEEVRSGPTIEAVPDENWVAISQAALAPVTAGRFTIHGGHDRFAVGRRRWAFEIEAGEAFGTAHHATTEGCLRALDRLGRERTFRRVLDLGCGSGVLAIAAARLWPQASVMASDVDRVATDVARANARLNRAGGRIGIVTATGIQDPVLRCGRRFDLVLANILAGPLIRLAPDLSRRVAPGGIVVLSGLLTSQAREVGGIYRQAGFALVERHIGHGWATLSLQRAPERPSCRLVRERPLRPL